MDYQNRRMKEARERIGKWMATATGWFWFIDQPDQRDVRILDIAVGLARQSRYGGQFAVEIDGYSVSEHSRLIDSWLAENPPERLKEEGLKLEDRLTALIHDTPEHLFGDMITPVKEVFTNFRQFEHMHHNAVQASFILDVHGVQIDKSEIKSADVRIRADEREQIINDPAKMMGREKFAWIEDNTPDGFVKPLGVKLDTNSPVVEIRRFLEHFTMLIETVPPRLPQNGIEINSSLRRHYFDACEHLGREPRFTKEGKSVEVTITQENAEQDRAAQDIADAALRLVQKGGPEAMAKLEDMLADLRLQAEKETERSYALG